MACPEPLSAVLNIIYFKAQGSHPKLIAVPQRDHLFIIEVIPKPKQAKGGDADFHWSRHNGCHPVGTGQAGTKVVSKRGTRLIYFRKTAHIIEQGPFVMKG